MGGLSQKRNGDIRMRRGCFSFSFESFEKLSKLCQTLFNLNLIELKVIMSEEFYQQAYRIALGIEYDGTHYHGWQRQDGLNTIQSSIEDALSHVAAKPVTVYSAGRTDTGVHAYGQVVHFDTFVKRSVRAWVFGSNSHLPKNICVRWAKFVNPEFHARYSVISRQYRYVIYNNPIRPGILQSSLTWNSRQLNADLMHEAAQYLCGQHDFTSYRAVNCQSKSPEREIEFINVSRRGDLIFIDVKANAFLHHMVRNIVGVLMDIGSAKQKVIWAKDVLDAKDRRLGGVTAPPYGLYLLKVTYPEHFEIPETTTIPVLV